MADTDEAATKGRSSGPLILGQSRSTVMRITLGLALLGWAAWSIWQRSPPTQLHDFAGATMGSTWSARVVGPPTLDVVEMRAGIERELADLDRQLSSYRDTAELKQLNDAPIGEWCTLGEHLRRVIEYGRKLHDDSDGAFDLTVKPLVNLWGFGASQPRTEAPTAGEIAAAMARLGNDRVEIAPDGSRIRRLADVAIDVDAIAPGYAADVVAAWLTAQGFPDHLVEIGGELRADGHRPDGTSWRVGIERPVVERGDIKRVIAVTDRGVATSGDYRAFEEIGGKRYSHTIDPATGRPADHNLASVTVVAASTLDADGEATTIMVLGPDRGMAWADARALAVYMIIRGENGRLDERYNDAFAPLLLAQ